MDINKKRIAYGSITVLLLIAVVVLGLSLYRMKKQLSVPVTSTGTEKLTADQQKMVEEFQKQAAEGGVNQNSDKVDDLRTRYAQPQQPLTPEQQALKTDLDAFEAKIKNEPTDDASRKKQNEELSQIMKKNNLAQ